MVPSKLLHNQFICLKRCCLEEMLRLMSANGLLRLVQINVNGFLSKFAEFNCRGCSSIC